MSPCGGPVVVAMSGGVDSSLAAALLRERGDEVRGVTLRLAPGGSAADHDAERAAARVAAQLGIPHQVLDVAAAFEQRVLRPAWDDYASGRTPNPCTVCNRRLKLRALLELARDHGASRIATGHHARLARDTDPPQLLRGADPDKDQSYFLFAIDADQRRSLRLPVGGLRKADVRRMAAERGLDSAHRPESQDACFVDGELGFAEALRRRFDAPARAGRLVDADGRAIGHHDGLHRFTIGQRRGLGVALGRAAFVARIDGASGDIGVTTDPDRLASAGLRAAGVCWWSEPPPVGEVIDAEVQIRYRHRAVPARVIPRAGQRIEVMFERPIRAVTPGQAAVLYNGERLLGGGWIEEPIA